MAKKTFTDESLSTFVDEIKSYTNNKVEEFFDINPIGVEGVLDNNGVLSFQVNQIPVYNGEVIE